MDIEALGLIEQILSHESKNLTTVNRIKVVFILSPNFSGSTWLTLVLGSHSWGASLGEYHRPFMSQDSPICRLCEANGLDNCIRLGDIDRSNIEDCHLSAQERLAVPILIDCTKRIDWLERFVNHPKLEIFCLHLVRNPCGVLSSHLMRNHDADEGIVFSQWVQENKTIESYLEGCPIHKRMVCYDALADNPETEFKHLADWLGHEYEPQALRYWEFEHHGLGANGAASVYLRDRLVSKYQVSDEEYYSQISNSKISSDTRWRTELPRQTCERILTNPYTRHLLKAAGHEINY